MTITIEKVPHNGNIIIKNGDDKNIYVGYTQRQAIAKYRQRNNLAGRHIEIINTPYLYL